MEELESQPQPEEIEDPAGSEGPVVDTLETLETPETPETPENTETDETPEPQETPQSLEKSKSAALTINFYSWMTPVVGILMLVAGLLLGYFGRPLIANVGGNTGRDQAAVPTGTAVAAVAPQPSTTEALDAPTKAQLMEYLNSQVRHFKGDENAPITMIEFSDFQ